GAFILIVAAGLLANSVNALHEAGLWNHLQAVVFDISGLLPMDSPLGSVLSGIFGYIDAPTVSEVVVYVSFLLPSLWMFLADRPGAAAPRNASERPAA
ncbi:FTR1 family protein, partial [Mesorhizobium sp.]|uniref:FTR1 family protein n=1 Tax=Mesorhizobium sp. TaxID=1871066 RepID=UPI0034592163